MNIEIILVDPARLQEHASELDDLANQLQRIARQAQPMSPSAYGLVGQFLAAQVIESDNKVSQMVGKLAEDATRFAAGVNACIRDLVNHDQRTADGFNGMRNDDSTTPASANPANGRGLDPTASAAGGYVPGSITAALDPTGAGHGEHHEHRSHRNGDDR